MHLLDMLRSQSLLLNKSDSFDARLAPEFRGNRVVQGL